MPNLTNSELEKLLSEYERADGHSTGEHSLTGAVFYTGISDKPFDSLPAGEKFLYNLIAETANEVLAEHKKNRLCGKPHK
jgi:hypothetical protein